MYYTIKSREKRAGGKLQTATIVEQNEIFENKKPPMIARKLNKSGVLDKNDEGGPLSGIKRSAGAIRTLTGSQGIRSIDS
jgi:hypothetical protein